MYVIIRTGGGRAYARRIGQEIKRIDNRHKWICPSVSYFPTSFERRPWLNPRNTIIHSRAAYPDAQWMRNLVRMEEEGYRVINNTEVLKLTSNKLNCATVMYDAGLPHPKTWAYFPRVSRLEEIIRQLEQNNVNKIVIKPYTSMGQGEHVQLRNLQFVHRCTCPTCGNTHEITGVSNPGDPREHLTEAISEMPTSKVIIQEYVPYTALYRIIVIGGEAIPISWVDRPTERRWKVSVCLNRGMEFVPNPAPGLLHIAEQTQREIGGKINFIDIFDTPTGFVLSEINTACNLTIHEEKARAAGSRHWNIAKKIAQYLISEGRRV